jgi:hypothetical protein
VGTKASGTITSNGTSVSDGDTVTIAGKTYTFKTTLTPAEGEVIIGADFGASMIRLYWAVNRASPETHDGVNYKIAVAHPLVTASTVSPYSIITLTAKKSGILGNSITLAKSASTLTLSGSTLTGGTDDVRGKMITQLESAHGGVPKFNGVSFPDTQVPSSDPNTLDDYEEGTWTPVLTRYTTPSEHTYTKQEGRYLKIGNKVTIWFVVQTSALITAGDGQNNITGLPFVPASGISFYGSGDVVYCSLVSALAGIVALPGKSYLHFVSTEISTGTIADGWNASGYMVGSITYTV